MRRAELIAASMFAALGVFFWVESGRLPGPSEGEVGPAYFPRLVVGFLLVLVTVLVLDVLRRKDDHRPFPIESSSLPRIFASLVLTVAYSLVLDWMGYLLATFLYAAGLFLSLKVRWFWALAAAAAASVIVWASFQGGLQVPLPHGTLF